MPLAWNAVMAIEQTLRKLGAELTDLTNQKGLNVSDHARMDELREKYDELKELFNLVSKELRKG